MNQWAELLMILGKADLTPEDCERGSDLVQELVELLEVQDDWVPHGFSNLAMERTLVAISESLTFNKFLMEG